MTLTQQINDNHYKVIREKITTGFLDSKLSNKTCIFLENEYQKPYTSKDMANATKSALKEMVQENLIS